MHAFVSQVIEELCVAFQKNGYAPTPVVDLGVLVASADGKIDERERATLLEVFQTLLGTTLTPEVVDALVTASVEVNEAAGAAKRTRLVAEILEDCDAVEAGLRVALTVAFASEGLSASERAVIDRIAACAGLPRDRVDALVADVRSRIEDIDPVSVRQSLVAPVPSDQVP